MLLDLTDENTIQLVWEKGIIEENYDPNIVRKDACGAWILRNAHGNRNSKFGWEIDHVYPVSLGGDNEEKNLRPMQWENNLSKMNDYPSYTAAIQADGNDNIEKETQYTINEALQKELEGLYNL